MNYRWKYFIPGHLWCLPLTLGYALFCLVVYRARTFKFREGVLSCIGGTFQRGDETVTRIWGRPAAQTIGAAQCFAEESDRKRADIHVHENTHVAEVFIASVLTLCAATIASILIWQSPFRGLAYGGFLGPVLYSLVYGLVFFAYYVTTQADEKDGWDDDYRRNFLEKWAYANEDAYLKAPPIEKSQTWGDAG